MRNTRFIAAVFAVSTASMFSAAATTESTQPGISEFGSLGQTIAHASSPLVAVAFILAIFWCIQYFKRSRLQTGNVTLLVHKWPMAVALVVLLAGFSLSLVLANRQRVDAYELASQQFETRVERAANELRSRVEDVVRPLQAVHATFVASDGVTRAEFVQAVAALNLPTAYPGIRGIGYVERVPDRQLADFLAKQPPVNGRPFVRKVFNPTETGAGIDHYINKYIEPLDSNAAALGFDLATDVIRRSTIELAVKMGEPGMTQNLVLTTEGRNRPGFLLLVPIYKTGEVPATHQERQRSFTGLALAPVVWAELLSVKPFSDDQSFDFQLFSDSYLEQLIYDNRVPSGDESPTLALAPQRRPLFSAVRPVLVVNQVLFLRVVSTSAWEQLLDRNGHLDTAFWGSTLSVLVAMVVWLLLVGRARAETLARSMTADIERLAMVAQRTSNAVVITDLKRRITWVNEGFTRITGFSFDEAVGRVPGDLLQSELTDPDVIKAIGEDLRALRTARYTIRNRHKQGTHYWLDLEIQPMLGPDGKVRGFMAVESDVTGLIEGQMALERERDRATTILEGTNVGTWEWNFQTRAATFNARWAEIVGYTLQELEPLDASTWERLCHPDDLLRSNQRLQDHIEKRAKFYDAEARMRHKDGHWVWVLTRGRVATWTPQGQPLIISGTHLDITERKHAEQSLAEATALLQNVLDSAVDVGISSTGLDRVIRVFNQGAQNLLGYSAEELVGKRTSSLFIDLTELGLLSESLELTLGHRPTVQDVYDYVTGIRDRQEWTLVRKDGSRFKANVLVSPMFDTEGVLSGHLAVFYDISKQKEFEASLRKAMILAEQSSVSKSQFLANMSHEIRTPMNAILGMLQLLESTGLSARQVDYVDKAEGAARSLLGVLNDILDFSKVEAGKMQLSNEPFQVETLLSELSVILSSNLGNKDVDLVYDIDPRIPSELIGDALRLKQVLINLGGNAVKFTEHGEVVIQWSLLGRTTDRVKLRITVRDTGIGIAKENQERIFEAFTQAEANTTRRFGGTGLGLVICTRLVRLMGGELELHSALGEGTQFSFSLELPLLELQAPPRSLMPLRVLVVDDNAAARAAVIATGQGLGWQVSDASSGAVAIEMTRKALASASQPWDAVLLDAHMPEPDGRQTRRALLQLIGAKSAPRFVLLNTRARESDKPGIAGEHDRFDAELVKPLTAGALARSVAAATPMARPEVLAATGSRLAGMQILLVEDNLINQQVAQELLTAEGAIVSVAENGLVGVNAVKTAKPPLDVVLMDMQMPVMDGLAAARLIRADGRFANLPIVAMTANAMASDRQACLAAGMDDHIGKPFDLQQLIATLVRHTGWTTGVAASVAPVSSERQQQLEPVAEQWPEGLDIAAALTRMGSNRDLLRRSILSFVDEASALATRVDEQLARGARMEVRREMHSFKGLAATLGAEQLSRLALQAEKAVEDTSASSSFGGLIQQIAAQLEVVLPALVQVAQQLAGGRAVVDGPPATPDLSPAARQQLDRLLQALRASDMDALELHATFRDSAESTLAECMQPLDAAMSELEFERAAHECEKLIAQLTTR